MPVRSRSPLPSPSSGPHRPPSLRLLSFLHSSWFPFSLYPFDQPSTMSMTTSSKQPSNSTSSSTASPPPLKRKKSAFALGLAKLVPTILRKSSGEQAQVSSISISHFSNEFYQRTNEPELAELTCSSSFLPFHSSFPPPRPPTPSTAFSPSIIPSLTLLILNPNLLTKPPTRPRPTSSPPRQQPSKPPSPSPSLPTNVSQQRAPSSPLMERRLGSQRTDTSIITAPLNQLPLPLSTRRRTPLDRPSFDGSSIQLPLPLSSSQDRECLRTLLRWRKRLGRLRGGG